MAFEIIDVCSASALTSRALIRNVEDDRFYHTVTNQSPREILSLSQEGIKALILRPVDPDTFYIRNKGRYTEAKDASADDTLFVKKPQYTHSDSFLNNPEHWQVIMKREVEVGEILFKNPHPNVCAYKGVVLDDHDRITGVAYKKYDRDLSTIGLSGEPFDVDHILKCVLRGLKHMHRLGLVHCDLKPDNILVTGRDIAICDFDATHRLREPIWFKRGSDEWWPANYDWKMPAVKEIDLQMFKILKDRLKAATGRDHGWKEILERFFKRM